MQEKLQLFNLTYFFLPISLSLFLTTKLFESSVSETKLSVLTMLLLQLPLAIAALSNFLSGDVFLDTTDSVSGEIMASWMVVSSDDVFVSNSVFVTVTWMFESSATRDSEDCCMLVVCNFCSSKILDNAGGCSLPSLE